MEEVGNKTELNCNNGTLFAKLSNFSVGEGGRGKVMNFNFVHTFILSVVLSTEVDRSTWVGECLLCSIRNCGILVHSKSEGVPGGNVATSALATFNLPKELLKTL